MSEPEWLTQVIKEFGDPIVAPVGDGVLVRMKEGGPRPRRRAWMWVVSMDERRVNHTVRFDDYGGFTEVSAVTGAPWKPKVTIAFSQGYGPTDRDVDMILDAAQFTRRVPRFS